MTYYDGAMAAVVIAGMIWGAWRGITWQLASMASLVLGYLVAHPLSAQLAPQFPGDPVMARSLAMMVVYAAVSGGVFLIAWIIRATLRTLQFEAFDRHLGMVLGGLEGGLIGMVVTLFVVSLAPGTRGPIFASPTGKVVGQIMAAVGPVLPGEARTVLAPFWDGSPAAPEAPADAPSLAEKGTSEPEGPDAADRRPDPTPEPQVATGRDFGAGLRDFVDKQESKIGRAIVDTAEKEFQKAGAGASDAREVERR